MHFSIPVIAAAFCVPILASTTITSWSPEYSSYVAAVEASIISMGFYPEMTDPEILSFWSSPPPNATIATITVPDVATETRSFQTVAKPAAVESDIASGQTKRDNPVYFHLECSGSNMSAAPRKCNDKPLSGDWCAKNCECTWTGCMKCKKFDGCSAAVVSGTCAAVLSSWDCKCVGNPGSPKDGQQYKCATT